MATVLSVDIHVGAHLILTKAPRQQLGWGVWGVHGGCAYEPHFTAEETEAQWGGSRLPGFTAHEQKGWQSSPLGPVLNM